MGNKFSKKREIAASFDKSAVREEKTVEEPAATVQGAAAETPDDSQYLVANEPEHVVCCEEAGDPVPPGECLPVQECVSECIMMTETPAAPDSINEPEQEGIRKLAPVTPEPLISLYKNAEAEPVLELQPVPLESVPAQPRCPTNLEAECTALDELNFDSSPGSAVEQETNDLLKEPVPCPPSLLDVTVPDISNQLDDTTLFMVPSAVLVSTDEPTDIMLIEAQTESH